MEAINVPTQLTKLHNNNSLYCAVASSTLFVRDSRDEYVLVSTMFDGKFILTSWFYHEPMKHYFPI